MRELRIAPSKIMTRGNGTVTSYSHDAVSRLASLTHNPGGTAHDLSLGFTHNPAHQIASVTRSNDAYVWDGGVNVDRDYAVNRLNQYTQAGPVALGYDARGNLTSSGTTSYGYTSENMLASTSTGASLSYDPMLRLYQVGGTRFQYDGLALIGEYNTSNGLLRRYVHGPGTDEVLTWYEGTGTATRRWLHADERGSVIAITGLDGNVIANGINTYDEYGIPGSTNSGRFQYTGQTWLPEIGMYHYKARIYSPTLGRFMQTDPIGYADGMNWYNYVGGDPINKVDPWGMECRVTHTEVPTGWRGGGTETDCDAPSPSGPSKAAHAFYGLVGWSRESGFIGGSGGTRSPGGARTPQNVKADKSCDGVPAAQDPQVRRQMARAMALSRSSSQRNPTGAPYREYGFSGAERFSGGYNLSEIKPGSGPFFSPSDHNLPRSAFRNIWQGSLGDSFIFHTHANPRLAQDFSQTDINNRIPGVTDIIMDSDNIVRCMKAE